MYASPLATLLVDSISLKINTIMLNIDPENKLKKNVTSNAFP